MDQVLPTEVREGLEQAQHLVLASTELAWNAVMVNTVAWLNEPGPAKSPTVEQQEALEELMVGPYREDLAELTRLARAGSNEAFMGAVKRLGSKLGGEPLQLMAKAVGYELPAIKDEPAEPAHIAKAGWLADLQNKFTNFLLILCAIGLLKMCADKESGRYGPSFRIGH